MRNDTQYSPRPICVKGLLGQERLYRASLVWHALIHCHGSEHVMASGPVNYGKVAGANLGISVNLLSQVFTQRNKYKGFGAVAGSFVQM